MKFISRAAVAGVFFIGVTLTMLAQDTPGDFTVDLPFAANAATPVWLGHPALSGGTFAVLDLPITPPDANASLLVTVFYEEKVGGFLRIGWQATSVPATDASQLPGPGEVGASSTLCENFYEGIGMSNQRSLLVSADTMKRAGMLHFQTGDSALGISRIKLEWLENSIGVSSTAIHDVLVTTANGKTRLASDLAGSPPAGADPAWKDRIVNVPVTDVPLRIEQGLDFTVHMDGVPAMARLAVKEAGLPWGQHLVVWLNNQRAGIVIPDAPSLADSGFRASSADAPYVGWRKGTFFIPLGHLVSGDNVLQFSAEPDDIPTTSPDPNATAAPLAVKDVSFEFDYPVGASDGAGASPASAEANAGSTPAPTPALPMTTPPPATPAPDATSPAATSPASADVPANNIAP